MRRSARFLKPPLHRWSARADSHVLKGLSDRQSGCPSCTFEVPRAASFRSASPTESRRRPGVNAQDRTRKATAVPIPVSSCSPPRPISAHVRRSADSIWNVDHPGAHRRVNDLPPGVSAFGFDGDKRRSCAEVVVVGGLLPAVNLYAVAEGCVPDASGAGQSATSRVSSHPPKLCGLKTSSSVMAS